MIIVLVACTAITAASVADVVRLAGRVVSVTDGDTIMLLDTGKTQHKIRLDGIDAPEKAQAFGNRSKQSLSDLTFGRDAQAHCPKVDRYGRRVCVVIVAARDVGLEQIARGMAWHFTRYASEQSPAIRAAYAAAEAEARQARCGLWRDPQPMAPWDWRRR